MDFMNMLGNDQSLLAEIIANQKRLAKSANYQFSYMALRKFFYLMDFSLEDFIKNPNELKNLIEIALSYCTKELKIKMPVGYRDLPVYKVSMLLKNAYGYIIAFDDVKNECECNFAALIIHNGVKKYYTGEYYAETQSFNLCVIDADDARRVFSYSTNTLEEFKNAVDKALSY